MPSHVFSVVAGPTSLSAATPKTLIELATGATITFNVVQLSVSFNGVDPAAVPATLDLITYTSTGTGTGYTPNKITDPAGRIANVTAKINMSVEGTGSITIIDSMYIPVTSGVILQYPLGREKMMNVSQFLGFRLTAAAIVSAIMTTWFEES